MHNKKIHDKSKSNPSATKRRLFLLTNPLILVAIFTVHRQVFQWSLLLNHTMPLPAKCKPGNQSVHSATAFPSTTHSDTRFCYFLFDSSRNSISTQTQEIAQHCQEPNKI